MRVVADCFPFLSLLFSSGVDVAALTALREYLSARDGNQHIQELNRRFNHGCVGTQLSIDSVVYGR